jgi:uncharacterized protein (DUF924 family)
MEAQDACMAAMERLVAEAPEELRAFCENTLVYARAHRDIIVKFGRFPHRNRALGRTSTEAEREWLLANTGGFGQ